MSHFMRHMSPVTCHLKYRIVFKSMVQLKIIQHLKCPKGVLHSQFYDCSHYILPLRS